ncbi:hypothetical protein CCR94_07300 [Rhodoblastus sphagnicola]|uniref:RiboL-PSP-HEPN domain-containing protein n=1 Tax=Rhodoblastus sphagnicola TaxID=333368 RepID=A0A2S6NBL7_9HYPH|nr:hypothetical protein [Rhodoblastus sphagnicola]MBB4199661.1 hypothetical protein [Rhodoblastus sphagnicola]PPQ32006.1 hypothetical protein CCR94_07300 [Rhodoblastus sphagnicola]
MDETFIPLRLKAWSQTAYGLLIAIQKLKRSKPNGDINVSEIIESIMNGQESRIGFKSAIKTKHIKRKSITYSIKDGAAQKLFEDAVRLLVADLVVLFDDLSSEILAANGFLNVPNDPGSKATFLLARLKEKVEKEETIIRLKAKNEHIAKKETALKVWSAIGMIELIAIRNIIVHNKGVWNETAINLLAKSGVVTLPNIGSCVQFTMSDLLMYRRAVRTLLNKAMSLRPGDCDT